MFSYYGFTRKWNPVASWNGAVAESTLPRQSVASMTYVPQETLQSELNGKLALTVLRSPGSRTSSLETTSKVAP